MPIIAFRLDIESLVRCLSLRSNAKSDTCCFDLKSKRFNRKQKALLHVAKAKLGLGEVEYRATLVQIGGVTSSTELDRDGFNAIMGFFEYLGFAPLVATGKDYGARPGMASFAQLELIRALWGEYTRGAADEDALNKWLLGTWKLSSLRFLRKDTAPKVITALKSMKARAA